MIVSVQGKLEALGSDWVVINVNDIGFRVSVPASTVGALGSVGQEVRLYTHLHLREDSVALYGFMSFEGLMLFQTLIGVSGVGPRLALALLSAMKPEELVAAVAAGDVELLTTVPGIGKKIAGRLILELKDKIAAGGIMPPLQVSQGNADVLAALISLGYSAAEANRAVASLPAADLSVEEKIRLALAYFARK